MKLLRKQLNCNLPSLFLLRLVFYFVCCLSFLSPVWTETKRLQGKLQRSKLVRLSSSSSRLTVWLADSLLLAEASQSLTHKQLISSHQCHLSLRGAAWSGESGQRVLRASLIGKIEQERQDFLSILKTEAWWENTEISPYYQTTSLTNSCLWVLWHFFQKENKNLLMFTPKLPTAALKPSSKSPTSTLKLAAVWVQHQCLHHQQAAVIRQTI